ncbi:cupin domain-containing protein [Luteibacter jiangsuensis]|uniref:Cupin domain-containing protein n=1 Tax=Luteibacter jiangsuensis TaxID=637577 RepID=A0ABX0PZK4_9GAMM|nr:cupin domain-containing protein [Luteibacter jiangsuensis]NID03558.1 cupin domain-containing protein [Luteibacter jiangsuensis]
MRNIKTLLLALLLTPLPALAGKMELPHATVTDLMTKVLDDEPGKAITAFTVEFKPGAVDPVHRHDAHAIVYVLEGTIVMGLKGQPEVTLKPGDTFYEGPNDIHTIGRNASKTAPAKFIVFMLKDKDAPLLTPVDDHVGH